MASDTPLKLTDDELIILCATLLRAMRVDRSATPEECDAIVAIVTEVMLPGQAQAPGPLAYREPAVPTDPTAAVKAAALEAIDRAAHLYPDDAALRAAHATVKRPEVQSLIYDAVFSLASIDTVSSAEQSFLDALAEEWNLPPER